MYYLFQSLAVLVLVFLGLRYNYRKGAKLPISPVLIIYISMPAFLFGRIVYFVLYECSESWFRFFDFSRGGTMFLGVLLGGLIGLVAYLELKKIPLLQGIDVFVPYMPLAGIMGRFGCFFYGCCWGTVCSLPWSITFPKDSPAYSHHVDLLLLQKNAAHSLSVHPSQVYAMIAYLIIFSFLLNYRSSQPTPGRLLWAFLFLYSVKRLILDFFRADHPAVFLSLNFVQCVACLIILATGVYFAQRMVKFGFSAYVRPRD